MQFHPDHFPEVQFRTRAWLWGIALAASLGIESDEAVEDGRLSGGPVFAHVRAAS